MGQQFDARDFLSQINQGRFDGCLIEELEKLTQAELEQVAFLMAGRIQEKVGPEPSGALNDVPRFPDPQSGRVG